MEKASWRKNFHLDVSKLSWRKSVHLDVSNIFISKVVHIKEFPPAKKKKLYLKFGHFSFVQICQYVSPDLFRFVDGWRGWRIGRNGKNKELTFTLKSPRLTMKRINGYFVIISPHWLFWSHVKHSGETARNCCAKMRMQWPPILGLVSTWLNSRGGWVAGLSFFSTWGGAAPQEHRGEPEHSLNSLHHTLATYFNISAPWYNFIHVFGLNLQIT